MSCCSRSRREAEGASVDWRDLGRDESGSEGKAVEVEAARADLGGEE